MGLFDRLTAVSAQVRSTFSGTLISRSEAIDDPPDRGEIVRDQEQNGKKLLVIGIRDVNASSFTVPGTDETVASYNPEYPSNDRVVEVRFTESLDAYLGDWTVAEILDREARGELDAGSPYFYPESRIAGDVDGNTKAATIASVDS